MISSFCPLPSARVDPDPVQVALPLSVGTSSAQLYIQRPQLGLIDGVRVCVCPGVCANVCEGSCNYYTCDWYPAPAGVHIITLRNLRPGWEYQLKVSSTSKEQMGPPYYTHLFRTGEQWLHILMHNPVRRPVRAGTVKVHLRGECRHKHYD